MAVQSLYTVVRPPGQVSEGQTPLLVVLHGLGSDEQDLLAFAPMLPKQLTIASVRAPIALNWGGYAWFDVEFGPNGRMVDEEQVEQSRAILVEHLAHLALELNADPAHITIAGFSQGAMMALGAAVKQRDVATRLLLISGVLLPQFEKELPDAHLSGLPVLITHGTDDPLLPISAAWEMRDALESVKADVEYHEYVMGHEINQACFADIQRFISSGLTS